MFTHLHVHTQYSLLDGACRINELVERAKELGQNALAITDHGVMYGCVEFYKKCKQEGIKPIIGCETYVAPRSRTQKVNGIDSTRTHLVLLCKNETGYRNLIAMVSQGWTTGFYTKPRIDKDLLRQHHEGLIALSGCLSGEVSKKILAGDFEGARKAALWYKNLFGDDFYLEIQNHSYSEQESVNPELCQISKELNIELVATNDVHYVRQSDSDIQEMLLCIGTGKTYGESTGMSFKTKEFYLKSEDEMLKAFKDNPEAVFNSQKIVEKCNFDFVFGHTILPNFEVPNNMNHFTYFKNQCFFELDSLFDSKPPQKYIDRLNYELDIINKMGYVDYFLIVADFVKYAKSRGIPVGPGRGSGAGSLAAYCMKITGIDPIKYNLIFERFLNPERVTMPDFDIDFCYVRRQEVIDYVNRKYGSDHVAQIVTFGTLAAKAAVRDIGRVLNISYKTVDEVAKKIPNAIGMTIQKALAESKELRELYDTNSEIHNLIDIASRVEGMPRHASTHAAGVVITKEPVSYYVPLAVGDENAVTQYTMTELEQLGLLKMDFLGLRNLTIVDDTVKMIREVRPSFDINNIPLDDKLTYNMLSSGDTDAVFQLESPGMKSVLRRLKPQSIEDITAVISLYRPGPADSIGKYIANKHDPSKITYQTKLLKNILDVTYGCMVYQEQVMEICRAVAGYSFGRADLVRRAMSKKKTDIMQQERHNFIYGLQNPDGSFECVGAIRNGVSKEAAESIFNEMSNFAKYAFNKSHACAYAHVSYQTAFLKANYPCQFFASTMTNYIESEKKIVSYIAAAEEVGIKVLPPNVNSSKGGFSVQNSNIIFGLKAIKSIGSKLIEKIINDRTMNGQFANFAEFCRRINGPELNRRALECLIKAGACDGLGLNRHQMLAIFPQIIDTLNSEKSRNVSGQIGFADVSGDFEDFLDAPAIDEYSLIELLAFEKEVTGHYFSGHPMQQYSNCYAPLKALRISEIEMEDNSGKSCTIFGMISNLDRRKTKKNEVMCSFVIEDTTSSINCLVFPSLYAKKFALLGNGNILVLDGVVDLDNSEKLVFKVHDIRTLPPLVESIAKKRKKKCGFFIRLNANNIASENKIQIISELFKGDDDLYIFIEEENKYQLFSRVKYSDDLLKYLKNIFGSDNVVYRKR